MSEFFYPAFFGRFLSIFALAESKFTKKCAKKFTDFCEFLGLFAFFKNSTNLCEFLWALREFSQKIHATLPKIHAKFHKISPNFHKNFQKIHALKTQFKIQIFLPKAVKIIKQKINRIKLAPPKKFTNLREFFKIYAQKATKFNFYLKIIKLLRHSINHLNRPINHPKKRPILVKISQPNSKNSQLSKPRKRLDYD